MPELIGLISVLFHSNYLLTVFSFVKRVAKRAVVLAFQCSDQRSVDLSLAISAYVF